MLTSSASVSAPKKDYDDPVFDRFTDDVDIVFNEMISSGDQLFQTATADLSKLYHQHLPEHLKASHNCAYCARIIDRFGGLVKITPEGKTKSVLWEASIVPEVYKRSVEALAKAVERAPVEGVFLSTEPMWGTPWTGQWRHLGLKPPSSLRFKAVLDAATGLMMTAEQMTAAKLEDFRTLSRGVAEYKRDTVAQAVNLLEGEGLYRAEKVVGPARFLLTLHEAIDSISSAKHEASRHRANLLWNAVAKAPKGYCTPRSSMVGTLLDDLTTGLPFKDVKRKFDAKMQPDVHQRAQVAPKAGNIAVAEKVIANLGLELSLRRRFARLDEITAIWRPTVTPPAPAKGGVFGHLLPKATTPVTKPVEAPLQVMTFAKFRSTVLPNALGMEVYVDGVMNFSGMVTAAVDDAPPIVQWDQETARNPFSTYVHRDGSRPENWKLPNRAWIKVNAITLRPHMWADEQRYPHQGIGAIFVLDRARDTQLGGLGLFPEILRTELYGVRSTIEAFSNRGHIEEPDEGTANGLMIGTNGAPFRIRVTTKTGIGTYRIDRWD